MLRIGLIIAAAVLQPHPVDRTYEGDWFVSDDTDNNTGERKVYAFRMHIERNDPDFVTVTMRCSKGKPTVFVEWQDLAFPDQTVLTFGPLANPNSGAVERPYLFEKSNDDLERGLKASPETSAQIISALGSAKHATITAHLSSGTRTVELDIDGTQRAWNRVMRHCPIQIMPQPPL